MSTWLVWLISAVVLAAAGVGVVVVPHRRQRRERADTAWSSARVAVDTATISRDAAQRDDAEADQLLARAERMLADGGGLDAAETAADYARRADRLWREAR